MTVSTYNPADYVKDDVTHAADASTVANKLVTHTIDTAPANNSNDIVRVMPSLADLQKPHSDQEFIDKAMREERSNHNNNSNLIASSREELPTVSVNGVMIDKTAIAQELQYHPAKDKDDALFLAAQALVVRELLRLAVLEDDTFGDSAWLEDEEQAISALIDKNVQAVMPDIDTCKRYYQQNTADFKTDPIMSVRHILLACLPEDGEERLLVKKTAYEMIEQINSNANPNAEFIQIARQHSACPSKESDGELGVVSKGQTVPEFESILFSLETGLAPSPIESRYGFHIVEVLDKQSGVQMTYNQVAAAISNKLSQQAFHQSLCDYLFTLSNNAEIQGIEMTLEQENIFRG